MTQFTSLLKQLFTVDAHYETDYGKVCSECLIILTYCNAQKHFKNKHGGSQLYLTETAYEKDKDIIDQKIEEQIQRDISSSEEDQVEKT